MTSPTSIATRCVRSLTRSPWSTSKPSGPPRAQAVSDRTIAHAGSAWCFMLRNRTEIVRRFVE